MRQARDHEIRTYFRADDYSRVIQWADLDAGRLPTSLNTRPGATWNSLKNRMP